MKRINTWMLAEGGICIALFMALKQVRLFEMPMGGSITAGAMVSLLLFAYRWGGKNGILVGAIAGVLDFILGVKYSFHPVSLLFDYPIAYGFLGIAGFFGKSRIGMVSGSLLGVLGRFACHVLSGVVVFYSYAGDQNVLLYSMAYNGTFLLPEFIISMVILIPLLHIKLPQPRRTGG